MIDIPASHERRKSAFVQKLHVLRKQNVRYLRYIYSIAPSILTEKLSNWNSTAPSCLHNSSIRLLVNLYHLGVSSVRRIFIKISLLQFFFLLGISIKY